MNTLLFTLLVDTVIAINPVELNTVYVHEWGIVTLSCEEVFSEAVPGSDMEVPLYKLLEEPEPIARAPVVYFYGAEFSGTFSVELPGGRFIEAYPLLSHASLDVQAIEWRILSSSAQGPDYEIPADVLPEAKSVSGWALNEWRDGPALVLEFENCRYDRFIYYENTIPRNNWNPIPDFSGYMQESDSDGIRALLVFSRAENGDIQVVQCNNANLHEQIENTHPISDRFVLDALCDLARGSLKSHEIEDIWNTWDDIIIDGEWDADILVLFPLTDYEIGSISSIQLETDQGYEVEYERVFFGMVPVNL